MGPGHLEQAILGLRSITSDHQFSPEADVLLVPCRGERGGLLKMLNQQII